MGLLASRFVTYGSEAAMILAGHDDATRKVIHAGICGPGAEALRAFCVMHGVTVTAFLDALGHGLAPYTDATLPELDKDAPTISCALRAARRIDSARRTRD